MKQHNIHKSKAIKICLVTVRGSSFICLFKYRTLKADLKGRIATSSKGLG